MDIGGSIHTVGVGNYADAVDGIANSHAIPAASAQNCLISRGFIFNCSPLLVVHLAILQWFVVNGPTFDAVGSVYSVTPRSTRGCGVTMTAVITDQLSAKGFRSRRVEWLPLREGY